MLRWLKKQASNLVRIGYRLVYRLIPIDDHLIIFISFHGRGYSDNPRAIYEEMRKEERFQDARYIWFIKNHRKKDIEIPGAKVVEYVSIPYFFYMSRAKYWIVNCKLPDYLRKKEQQIYLQTWHGTPLKRLGHDIIASDDMTFYRSGMSFAEMCRTYDVDVARYNYMISPNHFCTEIFPRAFGIDPERLIETGYPRNDFLTNASAQDVLRLKQKYGLPLDKKVLLYAPTWRDNSYVAAGYTFVLQADFKRWKALLGDQYVLLFKPHYLIINQFENDPALAGFLYSVSAAAEINELYVMSDALVTDYSSVFFDYAVLKRPIYFYMYDLDQYKGELRGFYLDIYSELPGAIYEEEERMLQDIRAGVYDDGRLQVFNERFNHQQTGDCAKKVLDCLFQERTF